jgi:hypothetical protein
MAEGVEMTIMFLSVFARDIPKFPELDSDAAPNRL